MAQTRTPPGPQTPSRPGGVIHALAPSLGEDERAGGLANEFGGDGGGERVPPLGLAARSGRELP